MAGLLSLVVAAVLILVLISSDGDQSPAELPSSNTTTTGNTIPEPLQRAIDQLDQVVRP